MGESLYKAVSKQKETDLRPCGVIYKVSEGNSYTLIVGDNGYKTESWVTKIINNALEL